ncbi:MAG: LptF/LptG family permease, partial [Candidatus Omnitrophica bacterium]|nr:LptF/LptG family permease [Candidatus Omnitrophota bacterium]
YQFYIDLPKDFQTKRIEPKITEINLIELKKMKDIDSSIELHKRFIFSITPLIFLLLGSSIGNNLKQKNKIIYIGIGGFIGIIFFELLIFGEIIARKYQNVYFIYLSLLIFVIGIKRIWK